MRKSQTLRGGGALGWLVLVALCACVLSAGAAAQSGRRRTPQQSPTTQPSPTPDGEGESESESRPRPPGENSSALASFIVLELDELSVGADTMMSAEVAQSFAARLRRSQSVSVTTGGRATRVDARQRAKTETTAFVVLVGLEDAQPMTSTRTRGEQNRSVAVRVMVLEPKTGAIKYTDVIYQRPVRATVGVGGIGLPIPTRTISRYPSQLELRQAAEDAADRLLYRFKIPPPPDQP